MKALVLNRVVWVALLTAVLSGEAVAVTVPHEPMPQVGYYRPLRDNYVRQWYIFNDETNEGILNPGDTSIETMKNWWTPVSSGSQGLYNDNVAATGTELNSAAQNWATYTLPDAHPDKNNPNYNYWLPQQGNSIGFYMSYSQFDNCAWHDPAFAPGSDPTQQQIMRDLHAGRNGYVLGWVIGAIDPNGPGVDPHDLDMDVAVHNGKLNTTLGAWGQSISDPRVTMSNDLDPSLSLITTLDYQTRHPALYDESTDTYSWAANATRMTAEGYNATDLANLVASQELWEVPGFDSGQLDHNGAAYIYDDAFQAEFSWLTGTNDGGVLAGLSGYDDLDPSWSNWGDQQVIRIQIDGAMLLASGITEIKFYDFGDSVPGSTTSDQVDPRLIVFNIDGAGNIYFNDPNAGPIYFPENRIFIAMSQIPEPASLCLLGMGGGSMLFLRRRRTA